MSEPATKKEQEKKPPIVDVEQLNKDLPDEYQARKVADESKIGGVGTVYKVPITSYAAFKKAVNGNGYDIDNYYGLQCWDGAALLWQQFGLALVTGNGLAIGCWDLKRNVNKYTKFDLITSVNSLKLGDVVCMRPNHIGFFDGFDGAYMRILGQNQGGTPGKNGGSEFNIVRITKSAFAGAFRLKQWHNKPEGVKMITRHGLNVLFRFYLGKEPTAAQVKKYVGKMSFDKASAAIQNSLTLKGLVESAKTGKINAANHLPSQIRATYKPPTVQPPQATVLKPGNYKVN